MKQKSSVIFILSVIIFVFLAYTGLYGLTFGGYNIKPLSSSIKQGLDLKGGIDVVEEIQESNIDADTLDRTIQMIRDRVDKFGVIDPTIQKEGAKRIRIQIPGMYDQQKALDFIGKTGYLKFTGPSKDEILNGKDVKKAYVSFDQSNKPQISLELNDSGKTKFSDATKKYLGQRIAIYLDEDMLTNPTVQTQITDGSCVITGMASIEEAKKISQLIQSGALPVTLKVVTVKTTGPTLGTNALQKSVLAGIIGFILVIIFMIVNYRLPGFISAIALSVFILINFYIYVAFGVTMSLAGIAGFLLTIGLAVDANVLIFERVKEELKTGKTLKASIDSGYHRAMSSIVDSNVTTIISGTVLAILGTGPVKGFAVTLVIGVLASMFTAIVITRFLLNLVTNINLFKNNTKLYGA